MRFEERLDGHLTNDGLFSGLSSDDRGTRHERAEGTATWKRRVLHVNRYGGTRETIDVNKFFNEDGVDLSGGHGGGDYYLLKDFID